MSIAASTREVPWHKAGVSPAEGQRGAGRAGAVSTIALARVGRALDIASVAGPLLFLATTIVLETAQPDFNPVRDTISSLVWGRFGWVLTSAFTLFGLTVVALALRLDAIASDSRQARIGKGLLALIGMAFVLIAVFPTSSPVNPDGIEALIHHQTVRAMAALFPIACLLVSKCAGPHYRILRIYSVATAVVAFVLMPAGAVATFTDAAWLGAIERVVLANGLLWVEAVSVQILLVDREVLNHERQETPTPVRRLAFSRATVEPVSDRHTAKILKTSQIRRTF